MLHNLRASKCVGVKWTLSCFCTIFFVFFSPLEDGKQGFQAFLMTCPLSILLFTTTFLLGLNRLLLTSVLVPQYQR